MWEREWEREMDDDQKLSKWVPDLSWSTFDHVYERWGERESLKRIEDKLGRLIGSEIDNDVTQQPTETNLKILRHLTIVYSNNYRVMLNK